MKLKRYEGNPILSPNPENDWESLVTTNPGAWYDEESGEVKLLYRAAGHDKEHRIHLGLVTSKDGYSFQRVSNQPVLSPSENGFDAGCIEDPRIIKIGDTYFVTYAARPFPPGQYWLDPAKKMLNPPVFENPWIPYAIKNNSTSTGLAITKDFKTFIRAGRMNSALEDDRDVIIFPEKINGKYVLLRRPAEWIGEKYGTSQPAMWISFSDDLLSWTENYLLAKAEYSWEKKIGGSTPPIKTEAGWLVLYHVVGDDLLYRIGALLLDLDNPRKILARAPQWLMEPEADYEMEGFYNGVIFPCGNVVIDGTLFVYYGGADKYVGLATCSLNELIDYLITEGKLD